MQRKHGEVQELTHHTASAEDSVVRALSMANVLLNHPGGLTREQIFEKVELYRPRRDERDRLTGEQRQRADAALEKLFGHDKAHLRSCGIELNEPSAEDDYRYRVEKDQCGLPDLDLTVAEQVALKQAQLLVSDSSAVGLQHALWAISPDQNHSLSTQAPRRLQASIGSETEISRLIEAAAAGMHIPVSFNYTSRGRSTAEPRRVIPLATGVRGHWYLIGHDLDRDQQRLFRLDRVTGSITALPSKKLSQADSEVLAQITAGHRYADTDAAALLGALDIQVPESQLAEAALRIHAGPAPRTLPKLVDLPAGLRKDDAAAKTERVVNMIALLISSDGVPPSELMEMYSISAPRLLRDLLSISLVSTEGFPDTLDIQPFPPLTDHEFQTEYLVDDPPIRVYSGAGVFDRAVSLTKSGALSLLIAVEALIGAGSAEDESLPTAAESAKQKILSIVPETIARTAQTMSVGLSAASDRLLQTAQAAITGTYAVSIEYADASGQLSSRLIDPVQVQHAGAHSYLRAWCRQAEGDRYFRLDRILQLEARPQTPQTEQAASIDLSVRATPAVPVTDDSLQVVLRFAPHASQQAWLYQPIKQHTDQQTGARIISTHFSTQEAAIRTVLGSGGDIEVLRPTDLREQLRRRAEAVLSAQA